VHQSGIDWSAQDQAGRTRNQFFALASSAMRSILVDHARAKASLKRGGDHQRVPLDQADHTTAQLDEATVLAIDEAMTRLAALDPRKARLVEMRFFGGLTADEAADVLGIARSTAAEEWRMARAWLYQQLEDRS
jgi:RNA polymerase sigma factor (TIGR02999 family)